MVTQPVQGMHLAPVTGVAQGVVDLVAHQVDILVVQGQADKDRHRRTGTKPELPAVQQVQHHLAVRGGGQRGEENPAQTVAIVSGIGQPLQYIGHLAILFPVLLKHWQSQIQLVLLGQIRQAALSGPPLSRGLEQGPEKVDQSLTIRGQAGQGGGNGLSLHRVGGRLYHQGHPRLRLGQGPLEGLPSLCSGELGEGGVSVGKGPALQLAHQMVGEALEAVGVGDLSLGFGVEG